MSEKKNAVLSFARYGFTRKDCRSKEADTRLDCLESANDGISGDHV